MAHSSGRLLAKQTPAGDDANEHEDDGGDEQQVNEPAEGMRRREPEGPERNQSDQDD